MATAMMIAAAKAGHSKMIEIDASFVPSNSQKSTGKESDETKKVQ